MFMALDFRSDPAAELSHFAGRNGLGVDGVFADCPTTAVAWRHLEYESEAKATAQSDGRLPPRRTCTDSEVCTAIVVFLSVLIGWAGSRYLAGWIKTAQHTLFSKYRRLDDDHAARTVQMTDNS